jgi:hypothetical protein
MAKFVDQYRAEARLLILRGLAEESDGTLSSKLIGRKLEVYAINRDRAWIHQEMRYLADLGAIQLTEVDTVLIGSITASGRSHLARRTRIEGVDWPTDPIVTE